VSDRLGHVFSVLHGSVEAHSSTQTCIHHSVRDISVCNAMQRIAVPTPEARSRQLGSHGQGGSYDPPCEKNQGVGHRCGAGCLHVVEQRIQRALHC